MNNSPIAQSPLSAGSTPGIAPKPIAQGAPVTKIVTSREWVLPPRPKPGRKPSADTPATKRKAQNRAAQRAFRERRATRVVELEQKLGEVEKEREVVELNWKNTVAKLQMENKFLLKALNDIKTDYTQFKQTMTQQQQQQQQQLLPQPNTITGPGSHASPPAGAVYANGTVQAPSPLNYYKPTPQPQNQLQQMPAHLHPHSHPHQHGHSHNHNAHAQHQHHQQQQLVNPNYHFPQPQQQTTSSNTLSVSPSLNSPNDQLAPSTAKTSVSSQNGDDDQFDCGVCSKDDCICAQVGIKTLKTPQPQQQTHAHPQQIPLLEHMAPVSLKRKSEDEMDFTAKFAKTTTKAVKKPMPKLKKFKKQELPPTSEMDDAAKEFSTVFDSIAENDFDSPMEQCGFCSDDSPCVCREAAKEAANAITALQNHSKRESLVKQVQEQQAQHLHGQQQNSQESVLPPISRHSSVSGNKLPVLHPGPTVEISERHRSIAGTPTDTTHSREPSMSSPSTKQAGCTGNPGTCTQCQLDPMSTLFCTTIASKSEGEEQQKMALSARTSVVTTRRPSVTKAEMPAFAASPVASSSNAPLKVEEKPSPVSPPQSTHSSKVSSPMTATSPDEELNSLIKRAGTAIDTQTPGGGHAKGIYIPCADAYKTLSRHKGFHSVDFSTLVGKLTTRGMQVEVQSVANVLRELDRRLYN